jgi:hypothetical protein
LQNHGLIANFPLNATKNQKIGCFISCVEIGWESVPLQKASCVENVFQANVYSVVGSKLHAKMERKTPT